MFPDGAVIRHRGAGRRGEVWIRAGTKRTLRMRIEMPGLRHICAFGAFATLQPALGQDLLYAVTNTDLITISLL